MWFIILSLVRLMNQLAELFFCFLFIKSLGSVGVVEALRNDLINKAIFRAKSFSVKCENNLNGRDENRSQLDARAELIMQSANEYFR